MHQGGIANMNYSISSNAESRAAMKNALVRIQNGEYAKMFITEGASNYPSMTAYRRNTAEHGIEVVGEKLRSMMSWITAEKIIDKSKS
jgi:ketol-acid reductoisomerase